MHTDDDTVMESPETTSHLLNLPAELIHHILSYLPPASTRPIAQSCRLLNEHTLSDQLWQSHLQHYLPASKLHSPYPARSFRELFVTHYPYWFLPKFKIWFSDTMYTGKLIVARYSQRRRTIEAYALAAERGLSTFEFWSWKPEVIIHTFDPKVQLDLNQPIIKLDLDAAANHSSRSRLQEEIMMSTQSGAGIGGLFSVFMLARPLRPDLIDAGTQVWPPLKLPAESRVRNASVEAFKGSGHHPSKISEVSEHTFRIRRWMDFTSRLAGVRMRVGEEVSTFATLPLESYTPTKRKPWRGIWCGDYSGHGCEFLVVLQPDEPVELPARASDAMKRRRRSESAGSDGSWQTALSSQTQPAEDIEEAVFDYEHLFENTEDLNLLDDMGIFQDGEFQQSSKRIVDAEEDEEEAKYQGQLMAVKLTGDPNIPRGEYTFIAPDIGNEGLLRVANEEIFKGARIVKSVGHSAGRGFRDDVYIPSQLILISHDTLAQYWEAFGHVSFYKRVDIDSFLEAD